MKRVAWIAALAGWLAAGAGCDEYRLVGAAFGDFGYGGWSYEPAPVYYEEYEAGWYEESYWSESWFDGGYW